MADASLIADALSPEFHCIKSDSESAPFSFTYLTEVVLNTSFSLREQWSSLKSCIITSEGFDDVHYNVKTSLPTSHVLSFGPV